ncbi:MAG: hypothetical protein IJ706_00180 [Clostridia bacterium]|nr:hypothetical protein [Clostridia bacterium]
MADKEAYARVKIDKMLTDCGWLLVDDGEKAEGITYLDISLESHLICFAAEESRLNGGDTRCIKK